MIELILIVLLLIVFPVLAYWGVIVAWWIGQLLLGMLILALIAAPFVIASTVYGINVWPAVIALVVVMYFYGKRKEEKENGKS
jgi:hypothetical protein